MVEISTSMLNVEEEDSLLTFYNLEVAHTDYYHIDVMDGVFVPNDTRQRMLQYTEHIKQISNLPLDVHLMVEDIQSNIDSYLCLQPNIITFQIEATKDANEAKRYIQYIKENGCKVGISIKPQTPVSVIYEFLPYIHLILVMTVEPGKGGQALILETLEKVKQVKQYIEENKLEVDIQVDGGITLQTAPKAKEAGADILVVGITIIQSQNYTQTIKKLKE